MNSILRILFMLWLWAMLPCAELCGQCPVIQSCPTAQLTICDYSSNDSMLWHDDPYTWSPVLLSSDTYEAAANLSIMFKDTCGATPEVSYTIFFDLEQDNLHETVITSNMVFPPGKMLYGNAFSPGYLEGDTMQFDKRAIPDSLHYRFALEVEPSGNSWVAVLRWNTLTSPCQYAQARLPEGRHRIVWKVVSGGVTKTCEYNFRVRDCLEPEVFCLQPPPVNINYDRLAYLNINDALDYGQDNICPENQLAFSIREAGTGTGFPFDSFGLSVIEIPFACMDTGIHIVEVWVQDLHGNAGFCQTSVTVTDTVGFCFVPPNACARAVFGNLDTLDNTVFEVLAGEFTTPFTAVLPSIGGGCSQVDLTIIPPGASYVRVRPVKVDNPLNGVSTFDLVLISKHILNIESFPHPWQYVAADANFSNTVTTFDIAQIRKLILGLVDTFPQNITWRFYTAECDMPGVPLPLPCPNNVTFNFPLGSIFPDFEFLGIKMGDVNGSAIINTMQAPATLRDKARLMVPDAVFEAGQTLDVPVYLDASGDRLGLQFAMNIDPEWFDILSLEAPELSSFDATCWTKNEHGALALSWAVPLPQTLLPDAPAMVLSLRARKSASLREAIRLDNQRLQGETYDANNGIQDLELVFKTPGKDLSVKPQPNPGQGGAQWPLRLQQAGTVQLELVDMRGQRRYHQQLTLATGAHWLAMPADPSLAPGLYTWRIQCADGTWTGQWVKM